MFGWFKKKEVKPTLIRTNPPAREIALANRKKLAQNKIKIAYDSLLRRINCSIGDGSLQLISTLNPYGGYCVIKRYTDDEKFLYLAARRLRKDGFKVKLNKRKLIPASNQYHFDQYYKTLTISWR